MLTIFILCVVLAYWRVPRLVWTLAIPVALIAITLLGYIEILPFTLIGTIFLILAIFANSKAIRVRYFTSPFIRLLKKQLPSISKTEREAIEAGNAWWEKDLFCGRPEWKNFLALSAPQLTQEESAFLDNQVETLCGMLDDWKIVNDRHDLPPEVWSYLKQERFFGLVIPKEYGGRGFSALAHSTIVLKIATRSISAAVDTMVPNSLGPGELIYYYGTTEQKYYYLPRLARGDEIPCFALTAPHAGSDASSITDSGIVCKQMYEGKEVIGIRLNWDKRYITLAPLATVLGLAFKLYDPDNLLSRGTDLGITLCLMPTKHPGVEIGNRHFPLHLAFLNGPTRGKDVFIPLDWVIGGMAMIGQGWRMLMECLSIGRSISLPALSTASGKLIYRRTGAYARLRRQFNTAIANFEGVEDSLGAIAGLTYMMEATRILTAGAVDLKVKPTIASAIAKYHLTESARKVVAHAMDIHGGHMIQTGPRNYLAHAHYAIPVSITVEGANILTRGLIIFGQGAIRCHPYVFQEVQYLMAPDSKENTDILDQLLFSHIGYAVSNFARNLWCGLTGGKLLFSPVRGKMARYYRQLTRMSTALALLADVTMLLLGGNLKRRERISARLGDILSQLYLASAVLKYAHDQGNTQSDECYASYCVQNCLYEIQTACDDLLNNYPGLVLGKLLRSLIFPYGRAYKKPKDSLTHKLVKIMLVPSEFRDRITQYCFIGNDSHDSAHKIESAFEQVAVVEPLIKKFQNALRNGVIPPMLQFHDQLIMAVKAGILNEEEKTQLASFDALYQDIIKVDEFSFDLHSVLTPGE